MLIAGPRVSVAPRHTFRGARNPLIVAHLVRLRDPETNQGQLAGKRV